MRRKDAPHVVRMIKDLALFHNDTSKIDLTFLLRQAFGRQKSVFVWVAVRNDIPIGFVQAAFRTRLHRKMIVSFIDLLYVDQKYRLKGLGKKLMVHAAQDAFSRGCSAIDVSSAPNNKRAKKFYYSLGFALRPYKTDDMRIEQPALRKLAKHKS
jgi:ribosomal protein S18 acetylase RimI-like enzyme